MGRFVAAGTVALKLLSNVSDCVAPAVKSYSSVDDAGDTGGEVSSRSFGESTVSLEFAGMGTGLALLEYGRGGYRAFIGADG